MRTWVGTIIIATCVGSSACAPAPPAVIAPEKAVDWAFEHGLASQPVYNEYNFGGYLIWRGIPTFIDGRTLVFGDLAREYFTAQGKDRSAMIDRYGVQWLLLHPWLQLQSPNWEQVYKDEVAVIYVRKH